MEYKTQAKLNHLSETKALIRAAIEAKGQTVGDEDTFRSYAEKITAIGDSSAELHYVTFMTEDGTKEIHVKPTAHGDDCRDLIMRGLVEDPGKASTPQYNFVLDGWSDTPNGTLNENALREITSDRTVYAHYEAVVRKYIVRFFDGDTYLHSMLVPYGGAANYTPEKSGYSLDGWIPSNTNITADTNCYAQWTLQKAFATRTFDEISEICEAGEAADYFEVGDTRTVLGSDGETKYTLRVIGINMDTKTDGSGKAGITVAVVSHLAPVTFEKINGSMIQSTHYYTYLGATAFVNSNMPTDCVSVIKPVTKKSVYLGSGGFSEHEQTGAIAFAPSVREAFGYNTNTSYYEPLTQYPGLAQSADRIVYDADGNPKQWFTRTQDYKYPDYRAYGCNNTGARTTVTYSFPSTNECLACFCI